MHFLQKSGGLTLQTQLYIMKTGYYTDAVFLFQAQQTAPRAIRGVVSDVSPPSDGLCHATGGQHD